MLSGLPADIAGLARRQVVELGDTYWDRDVARLIEAINGLTRAARPSLETSESSGAVAEDSQGDVRDIFISYVEEDSSTACALAKELRAQRQSTWTYEEDGVPGISYLTQVHQAIEVCLGFVLIASAHAVRAHQVIREVEAAHERAKMIIPVRIGLTHQEFTASDPILRMATGTVVTLSVDERNVADIARRIANAIRVARKKETRGSQA